MRDLLFRNLTSRRKHRRCLSLSENISEDGILARSQRHVVYAVEEKPNSNTILQKPTLAVTKFHDSKSNQDKLFCKMKGKIFASYHKKIFLVSFVHTLRIELMNKITPQ